MNRGYASLYDGLWLGAVDWVSGPIRGVLVRAASYAFSPSHTTLADVSKAARAAITVVSGRTLSDGVIFAAPTTWPLVPMGGDVNAVVLFQLDDDDEEDSRLLLYIGDAVGMPRPTGGTDITVTWPAGGIARLADGIGDEPPP